jgi:Zn-finger nucleic acid-binding protein
MIHFKITCPECGAVMITATPDAAILELCPLCRHHVWDKYDALMAEVWIPDAPDRRIRSPQAFH